MAARLKIGAQAAAVALVAALLALLVWKLVQDDGREVREALARGEKPPAPAFALPRLDADGELSLASLRGKVVVVNFWASWCGPCKDEAPVLERAWRDHRGDGLVVVGVDFNDLKSDARKFMRENDMTYPIVYDREGELAEEYDLTGVPETFVVDRRGRLVGEPIVGAINARDEFEERFAAYVDAALES